MKPRSGSRPSCVLHGEERDGDEAHADDEAAEDGGHEHGGRDAGRPGHQAGGGERSSRRRGRRRRRRQGAVDAPDEGGYEHDEDGADAAARGGPCRGRCRRSTAGPVGVVRLVDTASPSASGAARSCFFVLFHAALVAGAMTSRPRSRRSRARRGRAGTAAGAEPPVEQLAEEAEDRRGERRARRPAARRLAEPVVELAPLASRSTPGYLTDRSAHPAPSGACESSQSRSQVSEPCKSDLAVDRPGLTRPLQRRKRSGRSAAASLCRSRARRTPGWKQVYSTRPRAATPTGTMASPSPGVDGVEHEARQQGGPGPEDQHAPPVAVAEAHQPVVEVVLVGLGQAGRLRARRTMANAVSMIGTPMTKNGMNSGSEEEEHLAAERLVGLAADRASVDAAMSSPSRSAPPSPMKMRAGWKLNGQEPEADPEHDHGEQRARRCPAPISPTSASRWP